MPKRITTWVVFLALASVVCFQAAQSAPVEDEDAALYRLFVDALENVDRNYVREVDRRKLIESAIVGMLDNLDPYSNYIGPKNIEQFDRSTKGHFGGIGIQIEIVDGHLTVMSPLAGTPAYEAGILAGDRIEKINGESTRGMLQSDIVDRLTGPAGTDVTVTVRHRPYNTKAFEVTLTRADISIESVMGDTHGPDDRWDFMFDDKAKIGYIRINSFVTDTNDDLKAAVDGLIDRGMKGLIIDLRYNPGGLLSSAIQVSDMFVNEGTIVSTKGRNTIEKPFRARRGGTYPEFPMAVLVNQFSASASEILSACLQDHKRAVVIGERTWGKGSVQNVINLEDGKSALKLTTASYHRPSGANIHRFKDSTEEDEWGVTPDDGYALRYSAKQHRAYREWRRKRDRIQGKASEIKKAQAAAQKAEQEAQAKAKTKPAADDENSKDAESKKGPPKEEQDSQDQAVEDFEDLHVKMAVEYINEQLAAKSGETKETAKAEK